jgi:hypothetical protein
MNSQRFKSRPHLCAGLCLLIGVFCAAAAAVADPIDPGFDFFNTPPGGAFVDLGMGPIPLEGVPLPNFALGLTDTVVSRMDPGPPDGGTGIVPIELVALHLKSVAPIDPDGPGGPAPTGDLHITIDASDRFFTGTMPKPDGTGSGPSFFGLPTVPNPPSIGLMELMHGGPGPHTGASMRACFGDTTSCDGTGALLGAGLGIGPPPPIGGIFASAILVVPGGDLSNPADVIAQTQAPPIMLASRGVYQHVPGSPAEWGGVLLATVTHVGPHPGAHPVPDQTVPEPLSLLLAVCGFGYGLLAIGRRGPR